MNKMIDYLSSHLQKVYLYQPGCDLYFEQVNTEIAEFRTRDNPAFINLCMQIFALMSLNCIQTQGLARNILIQALSITQLADNTRLGLFWKRLLGR